MSTSISSYSDEQLLLQLRSGDEAAFTGIYERYWEQLSLYVLKITGSPEDARDIVQEVLLSIWRRREELEIKGPLNCIPVKKCTRL